MLKLRIIGIILGVVNTYTGLGAPSWRPRKK